MTNIAQPSANPTLSASIYSSTNDDSCFSYDATYAKSLDGTGTLALQSSADADQMYTGQMKYTGNGLYYGSIGYLEFDLSAIPADATIVAARLYMYCYSKGTAPGATQVRKFDFGATVTTGDFMANTVFDDYTLVASIPAASTAATILNRFPESSAGVLVANLTPGTTNRFIVSSDTWTAGTPTPTGNDRNIWYTSNRAAAGEKPRLDIRYIPASIPPARNSEYTTGGNKTGIFGGGLIQGSGFLDPGPFLTGQGQGSPAGVSSLVSWLDFTEATAMDGQRTQYLFHNHATKTGDYGYIFAGQEWLQKANAQGTVSGIMRVAANVTSTLYTGSYTQAQPFTHLHILKYSTATYGDIELMGGGSYWCLATDSAHKPTQKWGTLLTGATALTNNTFYAIFTVSNGASSKIYINSSTADVTGNAGANGYTGPNYGLLGGYTSGGWSNNLVFFERMMWGKALSTTEIGAILTGYVNPKYGTAFT